jgi:hypothetical protein
MSRFSLNSMLAIANVRHGTSVCKNDPSMIFTFKYRVFTKGVLITILNDMAQM